MPKLETHTLRQIASEANCDERSVKKVLRGEPTIGTLRARLLPVLERLGIRVPVQPEG